MPETPSRSVAAPVHDHTFGQDRRRPGESRTLIVIGLTGLTMLVEIIAGVRFGSMALLADGLHMASHTVALGISAFAYAYARRYAGDARFSFGTGKVNALGGFTGAVLLAVFALYMGFESLVRLIDPVPIAFNQAIFVAFLGLVVNGVSVVILGDHHAHGHHAHGHDHGHDHDHDHGHNHDHNLRSAYLHVLADALTSLLAIAALVCAKYVGWVWMDPIMGVVGAVLVARWSLGLLRATAAILLDRQADDCAALVRKAIEEDGCSRVVDLHVWAIGPGFHAAEVTVATDGVVSAAEYRARIPADARIAHVTVEVHRAGVD